MLTKNFYQAMRSYLSGLTLYSALTAINNSVENCYPSMSSNYNVVLAFSAGPLVFGDSAVPPTINDYWLSGNKISTISVLARSATSSIGDESVIVRRDLTVQNTSNTDTIVINEIGVIGSVSIASNKGTEVLVDRTVLDTPLTLAPGEQGVITYTINFPFVQ